MPHGMECSLLNGWIRDGALYVSEKVVTLDAIRSQRTGQMIHRNRVRKAKARKKLPYFDTCDRKRRVLLTQMEENPAQTPYSMCFEKYVGALLACPAYLRRFQSLPKPDCGFSFCRTKSLCAGGPSCLRISRAYSTLAYH